MSNKFIRVIPLLIWCSIIFYMSSQDSISVAESRGMDIFIHKLAHLFEYAVLYLLFMFALDRNQRIDRRYAVYGILFTALYGVSDEIHQSFNPTRNPRVYDVAVDALGGILGYLLLAIYHKYRRQ